MADVIVGSRTHELRVFTGSVEDAREYAAGLVEQLRDQGPESRNPYIDRPAQWVWTPQNWRKAKNESARNFRQGVTSCAWFGPAGLEVRIEDAPETTGTDETHVDRHGRSWDRHPFVQSRAVDNVAVCICGQPPDHHIHTERPVCKCPPGCGCGHHETPGDADER